MQDFLKKYRKNKLLSNIWIIATSLIMAFWINFLLIDWTVTGQNLKASILNANNVEISSDIYFDIIDEKIVLKTSKQIKNVKNLTLSIVYNPENISILNINSLNNKLVEISNEEWIKSFILNFENANNINPNDNIIELTTSKKINKSENLNIINANFTDNSWNNFLLSTSGITF